MVCVGADVVHVGGNPGIRAVEARASDGIDIEPNVVGAIGVMVQVRGLENRELGVAGELCVKRHSENSKREDDGEPSGYSGIRGHERGRWVNPVSQSSFS